MIESFPNDKELIEGLVKEIVEDNGRLLSENIELIIQKYALEKKMNYRQATPATSLKYYDIAVPDELLNMLFLDQKHIAFKFYELNLGEGEMYQLNACYVSEDKKETILFVEKNGEKMVLQTDLKPENAKVQVFISQHRILNSYQNSSARH